MGLLIGCQVLEEVGAASALAEEHYYYTIRLAPFSTFYHGVFFFLNDFVSWRLANQIEEIHCLARKGHFMYCHFS